LYVYAVEITGKKVTGFLPPITSAIIGMNIILQSFIFKKAVSHFVPLIV
jgi:hypothetical protein